MRISDWSSDVCSSDLRGGVSDRALPLARRGHDGFHDEREADTRRGGPQRLARFGIFEGRGGEPQFARREVADRVAVHRQLRRARRGDDMETVVLDFGEDFGRSEEHTSELQSLMSNSYAVFRLKK